ncbi:MAG TPA: hypothetical protein VLF66_18170, partial [Thermoanaerobaculia bacterium]|nr:hypothetical protein [Thermoanaerobaculia bacterium]
DGVDVLLRLCRLVVERVLSLDRLRALHDEWANLGEILAESHRDPGGGDDVESVAVEHRESDRGLRGELLEWLDSRLQPEGGTEARREIERRFGNGWESGEGSVIDLGRCWASGDGAVTDLLWTKHRWRRSGGGEALLDVAFGRELLTGARALAADSDGRLELYGRLLDERRRSAGEGAMRPSAVRLHEGNPRPPDEADEVLFPRLWALARDARESLEPLAARLRTAWEAEPVSTSQTPGRPHPGLVRFLRDFVLGIPTRNRAAEAAIVRPAGPVETLLCREGDGLEKALLLAVLLEGCGMPGGVFVSNAEGRAAAAVPEEPGESDDGGAPPFWVDECSASGSEEGRARLVPAAVDHPIELGRLVVEDPSGWVFHPLFEPATPGLRSSARGSASPTGETDLEGGTDA